MQIDGQQSWKPAESYNSILNKFVGGKRINFSLKGSYEGRCHAATISYHTKGQFISPISQHCKFDPRVLGHPVYRVSQYYKNTKVMFF
jgi:hypothetical protein